MKVTIEKPRNRPTWERGEVVEHKDGTTVVCDGCKGQFYFCGTCIKTGRGRINAWDYSETWAKHAYHPCDKTPAEVLAEDEGANEGETEGYKEEWFKPGKLVEHIRTGDVVRVVKRVSNTSLFTGKYVIKDGIARMGVWDNLPCSHFYPLPKGTKIIMEVK